MESNNADVRQWPASDGRLVPMRLQEGIWYVGTDPWFDCGYCKVVVFDTGEFSTCPGCKLVMEQRQREREFWYAIDAWLEASGARVH